MTKILIGRIGTIRICLAAVLLFFASTTSSSQSTVQLTIKDKSRPLKEAADQLAHQHAWLISYEDKGYEYPGDMEYHASNPPDANGNSRPANFRPRIGPRRGSLSITYSRIATPNEVLHQLVRAYQVTDGTVFDLKQIGKRFVVYPAKIRGKSGKLVPQVPLLSRRININEMDRDGDEFLREICKALSDITGRKVMIGTGPHLWGYRTRLSAINEPARDVLVRFLDSIGLNREIWHLNEDPIEHFYFLNFDYIAPEPEPGNVAASVK